MPLPKPLFEPNDQDLQRSPQLLARTAVQRHPCSAPVERLVYEGHERINQTSSDWRVKQEVSIRFFNAPLHITTKAIYSAFKDYGTIVSIRLNTNTIGSRDGSGVICYRPPPKCDFWRSGKVDCKFPPDQNTHTLEVVFSSRDSPRQYFAPMNGRAYSERMVMIATSLSFGYMHGPRAFRSMYTITPENGSNPIKVVQDLRYRSIDISFPILLTPKETNIYKLRLSHASPLQIYRPLLPNSSQDRMKLIFSLHSPPEFFIKSERSAFFQRNARVWKENDMWKRHCNVMPPNHSTYSTPTSLYARGAIVNVGRWTSYCLEFDISETNLEILQIFLDSLRDFNLNVKQISSFEFLKQQVQPVWDLVDSKKATHQTHLSSLAELDDSVVPPLPFDVRYQLEVCLSEFRLNEYRVNRDFIDRLHDIGETRAVNLLEDVVSQDRKVFDPMEVFEFSKSFTRKAELPSFCTYIRSATITPTTIYFSSPTIEISNRVLRRFKSLSGHFLRVRFADERPRGKLFISYNKDLLLHRVKDTLSNGLDIGNRHYEFLAFGNSQLREHGVYFYSPVQHTPTESIRTWMGNFTEITQVAKYAARLGQCFSTTRPVYGNANLIMIDDVKTEDGKYTFTDGVGKISKTLAALAAQEMKITTPGNEPPSVLQFRKGGCKGVLAVCDLPRTEIHMRNSQFKFFTEYEGLEVIRWSQFSSAHLNQQIIVVLSSLGLPDDVFLDKMRQQLSGLAEAMSNEKVALRVLQREVDPNQSTLVLSQMISDGFHRSNDPFMMSILKLWRAWNIKFLKEKAKIAVHKGATLLGCTDETRTLKGHFKSFQSESSNPTHEERVEATPEIFVQLSKGVDDKPEVIEGFMLLARNPSLHPGDIRVVRGVDVLCLRHLKDVVVLPQTGDRDVASMCSGGDLDGDDYLVIWDQDLLPRIWNYPAMDFTPPPPINKPSGVTVDDIKSFFVDYMKNDCLSTIALAHRAQADANEDGVMNPKCIKLARLHSQAVDFPKSGQAAKMDGSLQPLRWPHFMQKRPEISYRSKKVLGRLFDEVELIKFKANYELPFDYRILQRQPPGKELRETVTEMKYRWDESVRRIMNQYEIQTEFEVWSTFVLQHIKQGSEYKFHETIGQLTHALKETFRAECIDRAGGREMNKIEPFVVAMYHITNDEVLQEKMKWQQLNLTAHEACERGERMPMISFPWLFHDILGRIANSESVEKTRSFVDLRSGYDVKPVISSKDLNMETFASKDFSAIENLPRVPMPYCDDGGETEIAMSSSQHNTTTHASILRLPSGQVTNEIQADNTETTRGEGSRLEIVKHGRFENSEDETTLPHVNNRVRLGQLI